RQRSRTAWAHQSGSRSRRRRRCRRSGYRCPRRQDGTGNPREALLSERLVETPLGRLFVHVEGEGQLGDQDLAGLGQHPLLAGREALVILADRQVPDDLGDLVDVAALELLDVVLEPARPVRGHARLLLAKDGEHLLDLFVVDDVAQSDVLGVVGRHHERQVAVRELQDQVVLLLAEDVLLLLLLDGRGPVVGVDDLVTNAEGHAAPRKRRERQQGYQTDLWTLTYG